MPGIVVSADGGRFLGPNQRERIGCELTLRYWRRYHGSQVAARWSGHGDEMGTRRRRDGAPPPLPATLRHRYHRNASPAWAKPTVPLYVARATCPCWVSITACPLSHVPLLTATSPKPTRELPWPKPERQGNRTGTGREANGKPTRSQREAEAMNLDSPVPVGGVPHPRDWFSLPPALQSSRSG